MAVDQRLEHLEPDLERVACADVKFDYYRAAGLLGDAYARTGEMEKAARWFAPATQYSTTPETFYNFAWFLKTQGRTDEAREWVTSCDRTWLFSFENICDTLEISAEYVRRGLREWCDKAQNNRRPRVIVDAPEGADLSGAIATA